MDTDDWMRCVNVQLQEREKERIQESKTFNRKIVLALLLMVLLLVALKYI